MMSRILAIILFPAFAFAQAETWMKVDSGAVLYLSPLSSEWIPVSQKQKMPAKTYVLTKPGAKAVLFKETEAYDLPAASYFFVEDILANPAWKSSRL
jgi:hypothetical protein